MEQRPLIGDDSERLCQWCKIENATTVLYGWRTCQTCASGGPRARVSRWLRDLGAKTGMI